MNFLLSVLFLSVVFLSIRNNVKVEVQVMLQVVYHHVTWYIRSVPASSLFEVLVQGSCSRLNLLLVKIVIL